MKTGHRERMIAELITPSVEDAGYDLVRVVFAGKNLATLQIMIDRLDGRAITVDDCADVSRMVSALLDVEDPVPGAYTLEVSSPGIDRPLVRESDFDRFAGFEAKVEMDQPVMGQRRFTGRLAGIDGGDVKMLCDGEDMRLPYVAIRSASLVLTDELIEATQRAWEAAAANEG